MDPGEADLTNPDGRAGPRVQVDLIGEVLLLAALVVSPWIYGSVEDSVRYGLCAVLLAASLLLLWPAFQDQRLPRGVALAFALPAFACAQVLLRQSVDPISTMEAALVGFSMALVWASVDSRSGSASTHSGRRLAWALLAVCASESAFAAFQWSTDQRALFGQRGELQTMPFGSYVNHNNFAGLVSLGVPLAIAMAIGDTRRSGRLTPQGLGLAGLACGLVITVFASGSRGGAVALVGGLVFLAAITGSLLRKRSTHRSWLAPLVVGAGILIVAAVAVPAPTRARLASVFKSSGSTAYRVDMAVASLRAFVSRPLLGWGLGAFGDAAAPFKTGHGDVRSERAEADLIEFAVEGGSFLVFALILFARFVWRSSRLEMAHGRDRGGRWLRAGALSACVTMVFHSLFDFGFRIPANALAFTVLLGIATSGPSPDGLASRWRRAAVLTLIVISAVACTYRGLGAAGERAALARESPESRLDALLGLVDAHPYLLEARRQRGLAWMALAYSHGQYDPGRLRRAERDLQAVVDLRPQWGAAWADLGWLKFNSGQMQEARADLLVASRLDPTHMGVGISHAQIVAWSGDTRAAIEEVARLRRINPSWSQASARELVSSWTRDASLLSDIP